MAGFQDMASTLSGVSREEAFACDQVNLYERLGLDTLKKLSTCFYRRVFADDENPKFKAIFAGKDESESVRNQYEFFAQRFGGPPLFSQRKGHPALIGRHIDFTMDYEDAERWIFHMEAAMDDCEAEIDEDSRKRMMNFLKHTAYFIVTGVNYSKQRQQQQQS